MAYASDRLRERRMNKMDAPGSSEDGAKELKPNARSIQLTDEEKKGLEGTYQPGEEAQCLVTGRIDDNGKLDVISVAPAGGGGEAPQAAEPPESMRMNPMMMPG